MNVAKKIVIGIASVFIVLIWASIFFVDNKDTELIEYANSSNSNFTFSNDKGLSLMDESKYEEAKDCFLESLEYAELDTSSNKNKLLSTAYNNLCYANYWIGDYELSLEYGEKALAIGTNDYMEYLNYGNTLYSLNRTDEAMEYYDMAIKVNKEALYAYNGKGQIYYDAGNYALAREMFIKYLDFDPDDLDAKIYIVYCNTYLGNYEKALNLVNKLILVNSDNLELYEAKGEVLSQSKGYEEASNFYNTIANMFTDNIDAQIMYASFLYGNKKYDLALNQFLRISEDFPSNGEADEWIINCYGALGDIDTALAYYKETALKGDDTYELNTSMGINYYYEKMYMESIEYFEKAILLEPKTLEGYTNKLYSLYYGKRYTRCLETALDAQKKFPSSYEIPWLIGESYYFLCNYEKAIIYYKQALDLSPDNDLILSCISDAYFLMEDYENAEKYTEQALTINSDNTTAQGLKESITARQEPINDQLKELFETNYLYYKDSDEIEKKVKKLFINNNMSNLEIAQSIDEVKQADDIFTFTIIDKEYDLYSSESTDDVEFKYEDDIVYLRIYSFYDNTYNKVVESLDQVEDSEGKTLVIDLRGNGGGLTQSANNILDCLLPECVTCTLIYRDGYTYNYYSDASQIKFSNIFILVDDYTASASELLTLGLDTYLNNVTILGRDTYGKGVGQTIYIDTKRKLALYLINHYWNVKQQNIMNTSIKPDIYIDSDDLNDYMKVVYENK